MRTRDLDEAIDAVTKVYCPHRIEVKETQITTTVALRHGFSHLGRFSAFYHSTFGEVPSATLRRGRTTSIPPDMNI
jgi:hypothetical protein